MLTFGASNFQSISIGIVLGSSLLFNSSLPLLALLRVIFPPPVATAHRSLEADFAAIRRSHCSSVVKVDEEKASIY